MRDSVRKLAMGDQGTGDVYPADNGIGRVDHRSWMSERAAGFWSLLVSRIASPVDDMSEPHDELRALWLNERERDLRALSSLYEMPLHADARMGRNATTHASVDEVYDDELNELINERDGECYRLACALPRGVPHHTREALYG